MRNQEMAYMTLGSKADVFYLEGKSWSDRIKWMCANVLPSDVCIEVGKTSFHLHKFPLFSRSQLLEKLIRDHSISHKDETECVLPLHDLPGGSKTFLLAAKFCYGVKFELRAENIVYLRCAAEYLQMNEDCGEGNLISKTEGFLDQVLSSWADTMTALKTCIDETLPLAEELHIVSRCIDSLATQACSNPILSSWHASGRRARWHDIPSTSKSCSITDDWWYEDVSILTFPLFKRLILAVGSKGMEPKRISGAIIFYAESHLPLNSRSRIPVISDEDQAMLIDEIISLLPDQKGAAPIKFLLQLLRMAVILHASPSSREILERMVGTHLDQASLEDLLIPSGRDSTETTYDTECVERMVNHFSFLESIVDDNQSEGSSPSVTPTTMVASLLDGYLAVVAPDVNLSLEQFMSLASSIPEYARPINDGLYEAIDTFLKVHPWLNDLEREDLCNLMNSDKLSEEACSHAASNEKLPLRFVLQVLHIKQQRKLKSMARKSLVSNNLKNSENSCGKTARTNDPTSSTREELIIKLNGIRERIAELEKKYKDIRQEMRKKKPVKKKESWSIFRRSFSLSCKPKSGNHQEKDVVDGEDRS